MFGSCLIGPRPVPGNGSRNPPTESQAKVVEARSGIFSFAGACAAAELAQPARPAQIAAAAKPRHRVSEKRVRMPRGAVTIGMFLASEKNRGQPRQAPDGRL